MKILIVDRDRLACQLIRSKLEAAGHEVAEEAVKNNAIERIGKENIQCVFFDPAPLNNARPIVLGIRRSVTFYPYITLLTHTITRAEGVKMGVNDVIQKPLDGDALDTKIGNALRLNSLINQIGDGAEDFPSAGGVIAKSAFNQLFLSSLDRADRYGEDTYLIMISVENYEEIKDADGEYAADFAASKLAQHMVRLRRQSDIIAQSARAEYTLLLQRPANEAEPVDAANRFAATLGTLEDIVSTGPTPVQLAIRLIHLPVGSLLVDHHLTAKGRSAARAG